MKNIIQLSFFCFINISAVHAEIVKNSAGDKIDLKPNGTWVKVPYTDDDFVIDGKNYIIKIEDGNKQVVDVEVSPDITLMGEVKPFTKEEINYRIKSTSLTAQFKLKNRYSYKPKNIYVIQKGRDLRIRIEYTGENSYGAAVASNYEGTFYLENTGKLKQTSPMF